MTMKLPAVAALTEHANAIRALGKRTVESMAENAVEIGRHLTEAKAEIKKLGGSWGDWLEAEFKWSDQQARRFMHIFKHKPQLNKLLNADLPISALYLLAAPSTPTDARDKVAERAQAGGPVSVAETEHIIEETKSHKQPAKRTRNSNRADNLRRMKLGDATVDAPKNTSLGSAKELNELVIAVKNCGPRNHGPTLLPVPPRDDIGPASTVEFAEVMAMANAIIEFAVEFDT